MKENYVQIQTVNLIDSLIRNINDNFINISFDVFDEEYVQVKIILKKQTDVENDYIEDIIGEFEASQESNVVKNVYLTTDLESLPLKYLVYNKSDYLL